MEQVEVTVYYLEMFAHSHRSVTVLTETPKSCPGRNSRRSTRSDTPTARNPIRPRRLPPIPMAVAVMGAVLPKCS